MARVDGPRRARPDEFPEVLELVDRCFRKQPGDMAARLPFVYDPDRPERHAVVREDGDLVVHVAVIPQTLVVGDEVSCPGISGIATDTRYFPPACRSRSTSGRVSVPESHHSR